jgi:DNA-binding NtrC family response regulator
MVPDLSPVTSTTCIPRILIAERFSTIESLMDTIHDRRLNVDFDLCTSHSSAVQKMSTSPYQLIISGVHLAELDDFLLLKSTQSLKPRVPLVITADAQNNDSARRVLQQGAFDLIPTPLEPVRTAHTIRVALWYNKFKALLASRERALENYRQHIDDYPGELTVNEEFQRALLVVEKAVFAAEQSFHRTEESMVCFSDFATRLEHQARARALERLNG